jgi:hypothetical protein
LINDVPSARKRFTPNEDQMLIHLAKRHGARHWQAISTSLPGRTARQCRDRFMNYLLPNLTSDPWSAEEDQILVDRFNEFGSRWSRIAVFLPGRSSNAVKNRWYTHLQRSQLAPPTPPDTDTAPTDVAEDTGQPVQGDAFHWAGGAPGSFLAMLLNP